MPDKESRRNFEHIMTLMSVNSFNIYAGGFHSWIMIDDINPKKDEFSGLDGSSDDDSLLNSDHQEFEEVKVAEQSENSNWLGYGHENKKVSIQVNYTDTHLSHRFIRFQLPDKDFDQKIAKIDEYIRSIYKDESGTVYHRL